MIDQRTYLQISKNIVFEDLYTLFLTLPRIKNTKFRIFCNTIGFPRLKMCFIQTTSHVLSSRAPKALHFWSNVEFWGQTPNHPCPKWIVLRTNPSLFDPRSTVETSNHCMHSSGSLENHIYDGIKIKQKCEISIWSFAHTSRTGASDSEMSGNRIPYGFTFGNSEFVIFPP